MLQDDTQWYLFTPDHPQVDQFGWKRRESRATPIVDGPRLPDDNQSAVRSGPIGRRSSRSTWCGCRVWLQESARVLHRARAIWCCTTRRCGAAHVHLVDRAVFVVPFWWSCERPLTRLRVSGLLRPPLFFAVAAPRSLDRLVPGVHVAASSVECPLWSSDRCRSPLRVRSHEVPLFLLLRLWPVRFPSLRCPLPPSPPLFPLHRASS